MPLAIKTTGLAEYMEPSGGGYIKCLILGEAGVGKTPFGARWPKPIFADFENGLMSVAKLGVDYAEIHTTDDMDALLRMLKQDAMRSPEKRKYQTLVIDTIDSAQRRFIKQRLAAERRDQLTGHADWGWLDAKMQGLIAELNALPMNVVVAMHIKDVEDGDDDGGRIMVKRSRLKGDIKDSIWQDYDLIGLMEKTYVMEGGERVQKRHIRWHSEPRFPTLRDRSGTLPRFTEIDFTEQDYWRIAQPILDGLESVPESQEVESLEVDGDDFEEPTEVGTGGVVDKPSLPRAKPPAKKAAKKAPAKKAAAPKADPEPAAEAEEEPKEDPWVPPAPEASTPVDTETSTPEPEPEPAPDPDPEPTPEPTPAPEPAPAATERKAKLCGDQPPTMAGKYDAVPGCGRELNAQIAGKAQIAMVRTKTYLCDDCFAAHQEAA